VLLVGQLAEADKRRGIRTPDALIRHQYCTLA
jgi:hypothetical protein